MKFIASLPFACKLASRTLFALAAVFSLNDAVASERTVLGNAQPTPLISSGLAGVQEIYSDLRAKALSGGSTRVIVGVRAAFAPEGVLSSEQQAQQRNEIAAAQQVVLTQLPQLDKKGSQPKKFETIPFMAVEVTADELDELVRLKDITSIEEDHLERSSLAESVPLVGAISGAFNGYNGSGQTVAILDTGVEKTHSDLNGRIVSEACYSTTGTDGTYGSVYSVCPGGVNGTTAGSAMPYANGVCPSGKCDHGTHVAGIAAGVNGVARGANILAIQVFSWVPGYPGGAALSYSSDQILGLERVLGLRTTYNISSVNMSLGGGRYYNQSSCDSANASKKTAIDNLRSNGIATVISSGNSGYSDSMGAPGCISSAVSVGATWDAAGQTNNCSSFPVPTSLVDSIACYSNSVSFLNLLAPGSLINSAIPGNSHANYNGTSMAAPHVAGAWAVLKSKSTSATVDQVLSALTSTGISVTDPRNSITKPRINIAAAGNAIGGGSTFALSVLKAGAGTGTVSSSPAGIACGSTCSANFSSGTVVTLTATPESNSVFAGWSGSGCSGAGTCTVTMSAARSVSATFNLKPTPVTPLTLTDLGGAAGSEQIYQVQIPSGATDLQVTISGGTGDADLYVRFGATPSVSLYDCRSASFTNSELCLIPNPSQGTYYILIRGYGSGSGFSGVTLTVTYRASGTTYMLSVSKAGAGSGTVSSNPTGVSCGVDCQEPFASGSTVTLTAMPASGSKFTGWSGNCAGTGSCTLSMNAAKSVTATFAKSVSITPILQLLLD